MAALPGRSAIVCVGPPLFASGATPGSVMPIWLPPPSVAGTWVIVPITDEVVVTLLSE